MTLKFAEQFKEHFVLRFFKALTHSWSLPRVNWGAVLKHRKKLSLSRFSTHISQAAERGGTTESLRELYEYGINALCSDNVVHYDTHPSTS